MNSPLPQRLGLPVESDVLEHAVQHAGLHSGRRLSSFELLGNSKEVEIVHGSQLYRLRLTSLGKLILTK